MRRNEDYKVLAFDLDGTLTQHRTPLPEESRRILDALGARYRLLMVGAGQCRRIYKQMNGYPIDILGNYGMQYCEYDRAAGELRVLRDLHAPCDRESVAGRIERLRREHGYTVYAGEGVEYHDSGCITFPLLGTAADIRDKLAFDPDRKKRAAFYPEVCALFPEYTVFIGGSSSFDLAPLPYDKYYALDCYCREKGLLHEELLYIGDDYGPGGNDEAVYRSDFPFLRVDDYTRIAEYMQPFLSETQNGD